MGIRRVFARILERRKIRQQLCQEYERGAIALRSFSTPEVLGKDPFCKRLLSGSRLRKQEEAAHRRAEVAGSGAITADESSC